MCRSQSRSSHRVWGLWGKTYGKQQTQGPVGLKGNQAETTPEPGEWEGLFLIRCHVLHPASGPAHNGTDRRQDKYRVAYVDLSWTRQALPWETLPRGKMGWKVCWEWTGHFLIRSVKSIKHGALRVRLPKFLPLYQLQARRLAPTPDGAGRVNPPIPSSPDETALSHTLHGLPEFPNRLSGLQSCPQWELASFPALSLFPTPLFMYAVIKCK